MSEDSPRPSATIVLLRQARSGIEVFMLERNAGTTDFGGALVFPGGCVDVSDTDDRWAERTRDTSTLPAADRAARIAALREAYEEGGMLLARERSSGRFLAPRRMAALGRHRQAVEAGTLSFRELVEREDLVLATDRLVEIGHWITPRPIPRRFDTLFFAAHVPRSLALRHDGREAVESGWGAPERFLRDAESGRHALLFPTRCNLLRVAAYQDVRNLLRTEAERPRFTVEPEPERDGPHVILRIPEAAGYPLTSERIPAP